MKQISQFLTDRFIIALVVPLLLFLAGGFGKKLVRGGKDWHRKDWYLGVDAALAAISAALIYIFDITRLIGLAKPSDPLLPSYNHRLLATGVFLALSFFLFLYVLGVHQNWESNDANAKGQRFWLIGVSNLIGLGLMFLFVLAVKGVE